LVNGQFIFLDDYEKLVAHREQALLEQGLDPTSDQGQVRLAQTRQEVLESMIDRVLIEQVGTALGVSVSGKDVAVQVEADIAAGGGETAFKEWLETIGQTLEEYEQMTREALLAQRVLEGIGADVPAVAEQVHARLIIIDSEEEARRVLVELQEGARFEELVQELSLDVSMRDKGGDLGWFPRGWIAPELESVAFGLPVGEVSEVVRLGDRYYILQTLERDESRALSPDAYFEVQLAAFEQWLVQQRETAEIERFVGE
jgi:parvulin-like peptidyl-prolyl isomerase